MKVFKKLILSATGNELEKLTWYIKALKNTEWQFDEAKSQDYAKGIGEKIENTFTLLYTAPNDKKAFIWLVRKGNNIELTNITPSESGSLGIDGYNKIVDLLIEDLSNNSRAEFLVKSTKENESLADIAGQEVSDAFYKWLRLCNPSTGNTNALDAERWMNFVILCHRNQSNLDTDYLERYLKEESRIFDENIIVSLVHDYEYGLELLSRNDGF